MIFGFGIHLTGMKNGKTIGLALSGGAAKGFAHLGVMQALEETGYKPDFISGTSAGAIAAAFYSDGYKPHEILKILCSYKLSDFFKPGWASAGLMKSSGFYRILYENLFTENIEELPIPVWICITNLNTGLAEYHNNGNLARKVLASSSIPVFFRPVVMDNQLMVDGGVCDNLPIKPLVGKADFTIAVNVNPIVPKQIRPGMRSIAERVFHLSINSRLKEMSIQPDLLIEPKGVSGLGYFNLNQAERYFESGYESAMNLLC
ncbi:Patatin-like phospholipase [anaerobic digester metagenome]